MGWAALAMLTAAGFGALVLLRLPAMLRAFVGAALMLGAAGFSLQARPMLAGRPTPVDSAARALDPGLVRFRGAILGASEDAVLSVADTQLAHGDAQAAADTILAAIRQRPRSPVLWTALGSAIVAKGGTLSPAADFAFARAIVLAPDAPGPRFFRGMAAVVSGDLPAARGAWAKALSLTPDDASYRRDIVVRLMLVDRLLAGRMP